MELDSLIRLSEEDKKEMIETAEKLIEYLKSEKECFGAMICYGAISERKDSYTARTNYIGDIGVLSVLADSVYQAVMPFEPDLEE